MGTSNRVPEFFGALLILMSLICLAIVLPGCQSVQVNSVASKLAVQYAVMKTIEADSNHLADRAAKIREVAAEAESFFDNGTATLGALESAVRQRIAALHLSPADALLADALVGAVVAELQARVGAGQIPADELYQVRTVLGWIVDAAELYR